MGAPPRSRKGLVATAPGCLAVVAVCVAVGFAAARYLPRPPSGDPTLPRIFAVLVGALGGLGLVSLFSLLTGSGGGVSSRRALYARARSDGPVEDGEFIVATGVVRTDRPLTSPIGGVACAAYDFVMFSGGERGERAPVYWGHAVQPFAIDGRSRGYPVAGLPLFAWQGSTLDDEASRRRARDYVRATGWETVEFGALGTFDTIFQRAGMGAMTHGRKNYGLAFDRAPDVALLTLEERVLPIGARVSAFGTWSASQGAIVAPPSPLPASFVVVAQGAPEALNGAPGVPESTLGQVLTTIVLLGLAAGFFWVATLILPTVRG